MEWVRGEVIGCGCFSTVNVATTSSFDLIAVKSAYESYSSSLRNEKEVLDCLGEHQNIIRCLGANVTCEKSRSHYNLLLEYAEGGSLADKMKKSGGKLAEREVQTYTKQVLRGLSHVHQMGFAHLDIKPDNLLLSETGEVKIADFGLAQKAGFRPKSAEIRGTPLYMAPESVNDNEYAASCDVWALGCSIIELAAGIPAWSKNCRGDNMMALLLLIGVGDEVPEIPDELSDDGKDFLSKCFVKDPKKRSTVDMLLSHPFVCGVEEQVNVHSISVSPKGVFDFPDEWVSSCQRTSGSVVCLDAAESGAAQSVTERLRRLAGNSGCEWVESDSWISIR